MYPYSVRSHVVPCHNMLSCYICPATSSLALRQHVVLSFLSMLSIPATTSCLVLRQHVVLSSHNMVSRFATTRKIVLPQLIVLLCQNMLYRTARTQLSRDGMLSYPTTTSCFSLPRYALLSCHNNMLSCPATTCCLVVCEAQPENGPKNLICDWDGEQLS
jgi:hypothetical protein